jgi:uncharacterized membrane protein YjgN (DUF898 family)
MEKEKPEEVVYNREHRDPGIREGIDGIRQTGFPETMKIAEVPDVHRYKIIFSGTTGEYFRIWIVNLFLTVLTLGIYSAWAKVRTRRYFYTHTLLAGQAFDYMAYPWFILKGTLIIGAGFLIYLLADSYDPIYSSMAVLVFYLVLPYLIYKSLRFAAYNSAYRNIRFRFLGSLRESYNTYLLLPILIPLTLGLIIPYWKYRRKKYFFENFSFGTTTNTFKGVAGPFYRAYFLAGLLFGAGAIVAAIGVTVFSTATSGFSIEMDNFQRVFQLVPAIFSLGMLVLFTFIQQYIFVRLTNYCWDQTSVGSLKFQSRLKAGQLLWIRLTNTFGILLSAGLLIPWAKIRRTRYILDQLTIITDRSLDSYTAAVEDGESAIGEAATDFFGIAIGL